MREFMLKRRLKPTNRFLTAMASILLATVMLARPEPCRADAGDGDISGDGMAPIKTQNAPTVAINLPHEGVTMDLVRIPAGSFQMGSPDTERSRDSAEGPVHYDDDSLY